MIDPKEVLKQAEAELKEELFREAVEARKQKLREKKSIWDRIFPWKVIIIRKGKKP
jgi:hypothetical protein